MNFVYFKITIYVRLFQLRLSRIVGYRIEKACEFELEGGIIQWEKDKRLR